MWLNVLDYTECTWTDCVDDCNDSEYPPCSLKKQSKAQTEAKQELCTKHGITDAAPLCVCDSVPRG